MKKNQVEILEWKNTITKTKNLLDSLSSGMGRTEDTSVNLKIEQQEYPVLRTERK